MKLKTVCSSLLLVLFFLLLNEIGCIANYQHRENLISDEDRRAADHIKSETHKRGLYDSSGTQAYPSGYSEAAATFSNPGYSALSHYYQPSSYGHSGGGYGYGYGHTVAHYGHKHGGHNALALKGLLIPLAGIALLGAAAALSTNPVLLQLGVVNGRRRRRRSISH